MSIADKRLSTGLPGLDKIIKRLIPGDNVVWQVERIDDFFPFVVPFCKSAHACDEKLIYVRFGKHPPLVPDEFGAEVVHVRPDLGLEATTTQLHETFRRVGRGGFYVFDFITELTDYWYSDTMLGNFFMLTCPYIYEVDGIAYFPLLRDVHSSHALQPITDTTQIRLDVYRHKGNIFVHPQKVQQRYSQTMYLLHAWEGDAFRPITQSATISEVLTGTPWNGLESASYRQGVWNQTFIQAADLLETIKRGGYLPEAAEATFNKLVPRIIARDDRQIDLAKTFFNLDDIIAVWRRLIGSGLIGGKSMGMLVAGAILRKTDPRWRDRLEAHDSFFIGSDVFYTYLVRNGIWWVREKQRDPSTYLDGAEEARRRMLTGSFRPHIQDQFMDMLDYYGQAPIIVRSSSLLEDNFGNAFSGKYESVFCANQGSRQKRLEDFMAAVRTIYASSMSEEALRYRAERGILQRDEQMALLVQRVSGSIYGNLFYPQTAGVAFSYNPFVWDEQIDPEAGMVRLVFGLGTRAVDRSDDDYTRVVSLSAPEKRIEHDHDEERRYSQQRVDVLDLEANQPVSYDFEEVARESPDLPIELFATRDTELLRRARAHNLGEVFPWYLTFQKLLRETPFVEDMRQLLQALEDAYDYPVDVEFTANFFAGDQYRINLVQCRPFQAKGEATTVTLPESVPEDRIALRSSGPVIGCSRVEHVDRIVYVVPRVYGGFAEGQRHAVARLIGEILHTREEHPPETIMLLGPGRWGTTTPALGVPVRFAEINHVSILVEIVAMRDDLIPDVSLGTHFFNDLVEQEILYMAFFPGRPDSRLDRDFLEAAPNRLLDLCPDAGEWAEAVRVVDFPRAPTPDGREPLKIYANALDQRVLVCRESGTPDAAGPALDAGKG